MRLYFVKCKMFSEIPTPEQLATGDYEAFTKNEFFCTSKSSAKRLAKVFVREGAYDTITVGFDSEQNIRDVRECFISVSDGVVKARDTMRRKTSLEKLQNTYNF